MLTLIIKNLHSILIDNNKILFYIAIILTISYISYVYYRCKFSTLFKVYNYFINMLFTLVYCLNR